MLSAYVRQGSASQPSPFRPRWQSWPFHHWTGFLPAPSRQVYLMPVRVDSSCPYTRLSNLAVSKSREELQARIFFSPATPLVGGSPIQSERSGQSEHKGCVLPSECERGYDSESMILALASGPPVPLNQSSRDCGFRRSGQSLGHLILSRSCFQSLSKGSSFKPVRSSGRSRGPSINPIFAMDRRQRPSRPSWQSSNRAYSFRKINGTSPVGPLRCFATISVVGQIAVISFSARSFFSTGASRYRRPVRSIQSP